MTKEKHIHREITPLTENDCYMCFNRKKNVFSFPIHFHPEYEITFILNAKGSKRIVGDHIAVIDNLELVMVGPNLYHCWENYQNKSNGEIHEITIQFSRDLFSESTLNKNLLLPIQRLLNNSNRAVLFSTQTIHAVKDKIVRLSDMSGFEGFLLLQSLLYELAISNDQKLLTNFSFNQNNDFHNSERIERIYNYIQENYYKRITLEEIASEVNMTVISFSRLIKQRTGKSFIDFLNEIRIGIAVRALIETRKNIAEIGFESGFNNLSHFNRLFKKRQGCSPKEYRATFSVHTSSS